MIGITLQRKTLSIRVQPDIVGVVVLIKEGSDPATYEAASTIVEALRSDGFNATKGDWPADWRRSRGALNGPQTPGPTEAPIRITISGRCRSMDRTYFVE